METNPDQVLSSKLNLSRGPRGLELYALGYLLQKRPLDVWSFLKETYGDVVHAPWMNRESLFLFHPRHIHYVLKENQANYKKSKEYKEMAPLLGEGLLTSEGENWKKQRRIMAREFHTVKIDQYLNVIHESTQKKIREWKDHHNFLDVSKEFNALTFEIAGSIFFGAKLEEYAEVAQVALYAETERMNNRIRRPINFPHRFPTMENMRGEKAIKKLQSIVVGIMKSEGHEKNQNVLSKLTLYKNEEGVGLPDKQIADEVMTLLLAGHETTSNGLTWTAYLLSQHPEWIEKLRNELVRLQKRPEELSRKDLEQLPLHQAVWKEALRIYPPIPIISRQAIQDDVIDEIKIKAGVSVQCVPYVTHKDERFWDRPHEFMPERFINRNLAPDDCSYFPFAQGARRCIGEDLATTEAIVILAYLSHYFVWTTKEGFHPRAGHHVTLRSENGMWMNFKALHF